MSDEIKKDDAVTTEPTKPVRKKIKRRSERDYRKFYSMYLKGHTNKEIALALDVTEMAVSRAVKKYGWKQKKKDYLAAVHEASKDDMRAAGAMVNTLIKTGIQQILKQHQENPDQKISLETLSELRKFSEYINKEARLDDGKPTENTSGVVRHTIVLPPNAKRWGIEAPSTSVKILEHSEVEVKNKEEDDFEPIE